jgi:hypothetical protein
MFTVSRLCFFYIIFVLKNNNIVPLIRSYASYMFVYNILGFVSNFKFFQILAASIICQKSLYVPILS